MQLFFVENIESDLYTLPEDESKHCVRVLRKAEGDYIHLTDGCGTMAKARIVDAHPKRCQVEIEERIANYGQRPFAMHLAVAPTKNTARMEWLIEKAVEIGVDYITFLVCDHSERVTLNIDRLDKIAISAMKQSLKAFKPVLQVAKYQDFILQSDHFCGHKLIAHCDGDDRMPIQQVLEPRKNVMILIGPEGDFSDREVSMAISHHFVAVTLGESRLRTETAALFGVVAANLYSTHQ